MAVEKRLGSSTVCSRYINYKLGINMVCINKLYIFVFAAYIAGA
ncbi:MAG TPA: hypothetical protein VIN10_05980 [Bacteroidales bacterium]